jgi:protein pelota
VRIIEEDLKRGYLKIQCETLDDLWVLYNVIREGDIIYAKTTREVKFHESGEGSRIPMVLGIFVKKVEFQQFTDKLRVSGIIVDGPEEFGVKGKHHTVAIGVGDVIAIIRDKWDEYELAFIKKFTTRRPKVAVVAVDYEEACVALILEQGVKYVWDSVNNLPSKAYSVDYESTLKKYILHIANSVTEIAKGERVDAIVVVGPGEIKDRVANVVRGSLNLPVYVDSTSSGGCHGVREALNRDIVKKITGEFLLIKAQNILEYFKELLSRDPSMVVYGLEDVFSACQIGAVKVVLIVDDMLKSSSDEERRRVYELLKFAYEQGTEIIIVPSRSDLGLEVQGFGGVIGILRFRIQIL